MQRLATMMSVLLPISLTGVTPALAEADNIPPPAIDIDSRIEIAFGVAFTTDYISKGSTQTGNGPAVQPYIEASYNLFYVGIWASNVEFGGVKDVEVDFYGGIKPEFGKLSLDLGFGYYYYRKDPANYGEFYAKADYAVTDDFTAGAHIYQEPYADQTWADLVAEYSGLPFDLSVSAKLGSDFGTRKLGDYKYAWNVGVARNLTEAISVDLRYYDSNYDPGRFVATLSFDSSGAAIRELLGDK